MVWFPFDDSAVPVAAEVCEEVFFGQFVTASTASPSEQQSVSMWSQVGGIGTVFRVDSPEGEAHQMVTDGDGVILLNEGSAEPNTRYDKEGNVTWTWQRPYPESGSYQDWTADAVTHNGVTYFVVPWVESTRIYKRLADGSDSLLATIPWTHFGVSSVAEIDSVAISADGSTLFLLTAQGSDVGAIVGMDSSTGSVLWTHTLVAEMSATNWQKPMIRTRPGTDTIFVALHEAAGGITVTPTLTRLDFASGLSSAPSQTWKWTADGFNTFLPGSGLAVSADVVVMGHTNVKNTFEGEEVVDVEDPWLATAFDMDGNELWRLLGASFMYAYPHAVAIAGGRVLVGVVDDYVELSGWGWRVFDATTGAHFISGPMPLDVDTLGPAASACVTGVNPPS